MENQPFIFSVGSNPGKRSSSLIPTGIVSNVGREIFKCKGNLGSAQAFSRRELNLSSAYLIRVTSVMLTSAEPTSKALICEIKF